MYSRSPDDDTVLACVPVDEGCLRLRVQTSSDAFIEGELVEATCHASDEPLAGVERFDASVGWGHGNLLIFGELELDDGTILPLEVQAPRVGLVDGAQCN